MSADSSVAVAASSKLSYRTIILVIASRSDIYDRFIQQHWIYFMEYIRIKYPNLKCLLLFGRGDISDLGLHPDDYLQFDIEETYVPGILEKTIAGFKYVEDNYHYDHIFRTNLSSGIILDRFIERIYDFPSDGAYEGVFNTHNHPLQLDAPHIFSGEHDYHAKLQEQRMKYGSRSIKFICGAGILLSRDKVRLLIDRADEMDLTMVDDVAIGEMLFRDETGYRVGLRHDARYNKYDRVYSRKNILGIDKKYFHIRFHNPHRELDVKMLSLINPIFHRLGYNELIGTLIKLRSSNSLQRVRHLCDTIFNSDQYKYSKRELSRILDEYYLACYYLGDFTQCQNIATYVRNEKLLCYTDCPQHLINNFTYIGANIKPVWNMHIVTMMFDIGVRSADTYFERCQLFKFDLPMTIFTNKSNVERIPDKPNITVVEIELDELMNYKFLDKIEENRKVRPAPDPKFTTLSYILYISKFDIVMRALPSIKEEKVVWLDFGLIEPLSYERLADIDNHEISGFRLCLLHYRPRSLVSNNEEFYRVMHYSMAAGVMVGTKTDWIKMIGLVQYEFEDKVAKGYGHSEEQMLTVIYAKYPHLFDMYYGDYEFLLRNYIHIKAKYDHIVNLVLRPLLTDGRQEEVNKLMRVIEESRQLGYIS